MKDHLKRLFRGTFIYSGGQVLSRIVTFLLLPLTTSYLTPADYGLIGTLAIITTFLNGFYTLGFGVSMGRCYWSTDHRKERDGVIWAAFGALSINGLLWTVIALLFSTKISWLALNSNAYSELIVITFLSLALSGALLPFTSYLRMEEKAFLSVCLSLFEVLASIGFTIYFVMFVEMGAKGVVLAGFVAQVLAFILTLAICTRFLHFQIGWKYVPEMIKVGFPYIFGLIGYFLLQCTSRYTLQFFSSMSDVGLFYMGSNFARMIELAVSGFISAWCPFFISFLNKQEEAVQVFGRVLSYFVMAMCALVILFFASSRPLVHLMVQPNFHSIWTQVGILAASQALWGVYCISAAALVFFKKTVWQLWIEIAAGTISVGLNCLFIPFFNTGGAAIATFLSFFCLAWISFLVNQRLLKIAYEWGRIFKAVAALVVAAIFSFIPLPMGPYILLMSCTVLSYYLFLWQICLTSSERQTIFSYLPMKKSEVVNH